MTPPPGSSARLTVRNRRRPARQPSRGPCRTPPPPIRADPHSFDRSASFHIRLAARFGVHRPTLGRTTRCSGRALPGWRVWTAVHAPVLRRRQTSDAPVRRWPFAAGSLDALSRSICRRCRSTFPQPSPPDPQATAPPDRRPAPLCVPGTALSAKHSPMVKTPMYHLNVLEAVPLPPQDPQTDSFASPVSQITATIPGAVR